MSCNVLVILGPTATGKTDLAIESAKLLDGEIVSCDSRQLYAGLDIGSGKLPGQYETLEKGQGRWVIDGVVIWGYDLASPLLRFNVKNYIDYTSAKVAEIVGRGKLPIIVGGTGLYLKMLLHGMSELGDVDGRLREELTSLGLRELQDKLRHLSPATWAKLNSSEQGNGRRLIRHIEKLSQRTKNSDSSAGLESIYSVLKIGLDGPRGVLNERIDRRVVSRVECGMIDEAKRLQSEGVSLARMRELGLEYRELANLLAGELDEKGFVLQLQTKIHQYAKRQQTWFKREPEVVWFDIAASDWHQKLVKVVTDWYNISCESTN